MDKEYYVYIMASESRVIYTGVTSDLESRVWQHKQKVKKGFTQKYNCFKLVWYEETNDVWDALEFEKKIKGWKRDKKVAMIEEENPKWCDLAKEWFQ